MEDTWLTKPLFKTKPNQVERFFHEMHYLRKVEGRDLISEVAEYIYLLNL